MLRIAARDGLLAASMRAVAAEAGVSLRLVQYYFTTKDELLMDGLARLGTQLDARMRRWIAAAGDPPAPHRVVAATLRSILPTDQESRRITRTYTAYYTLVLDEPDLVDGERARLQRSRRPADRCCRTGGSRPSPRRAVRRP